MRVGRHFLASEFGAVPDAAVPGLGFLCGLFLDPLRDRFGLCRVWSGFRTPAKNREVGGAPESRHLYLSFPLEVAADVTFARGQPAEWAAAARGIADAVRRGGVGRYDRHLHVDVGPRRSW